VINRELLASSFVTLFVIMDPVGTVPLFLSLTSGRAAATARKAAWQAVLVSFGVIAVFAFFGQAILHYLGISVASLQCAGGLLLLLVALELLTGKHGVDPAVGDTNVALVPLGTPLLAGPGAIAATMIFARKVHGFDDFWAVAIGIVAVHVILWLVMRFSLPILKIVREGGVMLVTRIAGLLLAAIAVQMIEDALQVFIEGI
jgi:multiple antibiotic resistance protein